MKKFDELTKEELEDLYFTQDLSKSQLRQMFGVSENQVRARLQKFGLNKQQKLVKDSALEAIELMRKRYIDKGKEDQFEDDLLMR